MKYLVTIIDSSMNHTIYYITGSTESFFVSLPHNYNQNIKVNVLIKQGTYNILSESVSIMQKNLHKIFDNLNLQNNLIIIPILDESYEKQNYTLVKSEIANALDFCFKMLSMRAISYEKQVALINLSKDYETFEEQILQETPNYTKRNISSIIKDAPTLEKLKEQKSKKQLILSQSSGYVLYSAIALILVLAYFIVVSIIFTKS